MVLLVLEVHAGVAKDPQHFRQLIVFLVHNFRADNSLLERLVASNNPPFRYLERTYYLVGQNISRYRRGALIVRRMCVLLDAERVYRELSTILEGEDNLDFASTMVQVLSHFLHFFN